MTVELRAYTDDELRGIAPLNVGQNHWRNPFHGFTCPVGAKLANRWAWLHWPEDMARENGENASGEVDPFEAMEHTLAVKRSGFHRAEGPQGFAAFPVVPNYSSRSEAQRKLESDWETRCRVMHESQTTITLEQKPKDTGYRPTRLVGEYDGRNTPAKFEDSEDSRRLRRGD
jgi:hypothetical protein